MARNSIAAAKQELHGLLTSGGLPAGLAAVYDHEPLAGHIQKPAAATVFTAGMTAVDYLIGIRIYISAEADAAKAQADLDTLIMTVDGRMTSGFGPSNWTVTYQADLSAFVAENLFEVGREDQTAWG
ncbi:MAG: hypothetical protein LC798_19375 [Chloroflexi bacterium]|nr:hypothetical protein [Chloroflexota bacterium]